MDTYTDRLQPISQAWLERNGKWFVPIAIVSVGAFIFGVFIWVTGAIKSTEPYQGALAKAKACPEVQTALGTPITDGFMSTGQINIGESTGSALLEIPISGPKGKANIEVKAEMSSGNWSYSTLEVVIAGQAEKIDLKN